MIGILYNTKPPSASETAEAFCDAVMRNDKKTQKLLTTFEKIPTSIAKAIGELSQEHKEIAKNYNVRILKEYDDENFEYQIVALTAQNQTDEIFFTCQFVANQWVIIKIKIAEKEKNE